MRVYHFDKKRRHTHYTAWKLGRTRPPETRERKSSWKNISYVRSLVSFFKSYFRRSSLSEIFIVRVPFSRVWFLRVYFQEFVLLEFLFKSQYGVRVPFQEFVLSEFLFKSLICQNSFFKSLHCQSLFSIVCMVRIPFQEFLLS